MWSVRLKLTGLILGSMVPALVAVLIGSLAARQRLFEQAAEVIDGSAETFERIVDDSLKGRRAPLVMAAENAYLGRILADGDHEAVRDYLEPLKKAYRKRVVLLSDAEGHIIASGNPEKGPVSLGPSGSPVFGELLSGDEVMGLIPITLAEGPGHALVAAAPIFHERQQVGALAVFSPVTDSYLSYLGRRVRAELSVRANDVHVAATKDHAAPQLHTRAGEAGFEERAEHWWVVKSFYPEDLQRTGLSVEVTVSRDVTKLRKQMLTTVLSELAVIGGVSLLVLVLALVFAGRIARAVRGISDAAREVKEGRYVTAPVLHSRDELESLTLHFNDMVEGLKERDRLKETFGRYVTRQVADHLMKADQRLGGELVPVTVLFSDIRSFTSISERMEPRALLDFLNEYFSSMVESVLRHRGVVDKFIGDAIMAVFGAPAPEPEDPLRAVCAALEMRRRLEEINADFRTRGLPEIRTGIGLHSGQVVAGNMGHSERMEYTVIGDTVNLASRLEGMTKELGCDVLVSEDLYQQVSEQVEAEPLKVIKVKGRDREVMVYRLIGLREGVSET